MWQKPGQSKLAGQSSPPSLAQAVGIYRPPGCLTVWVQQCSWVDRNSWAGQGIVLFHDSPQRLGIAGCKYKGMASQKLSAMMDQKGLRCFPTKEVFIVIGNKQKHRENVKI